MRTALAADHPARLVSEQIAALGLGHLVMVHCSLRALGPVAGGVDTVLAALRQAVGRDGTLTVPTFTTENSDTSDPYRERVRGLDEGAVAAFRAAMPPFDPEHSRAPLMGVLAETVRQTPGAARSEHPQTSFAALGPAADKIVTGHHRDCHLGEDSPLARLYELDAEVLLLGVGFEVLTAFHLAEYRVPVSPRRTYRCVVRAEDGERRWWEYEDAVLDDGDFARIGADFERVSGAVRTVPVGSGTARLLRLRDAVDFATEWLPAHRSYPRVTPDG